jgi:hypothetical protein
MTAPRKPSWKPDAASASPPAHAPGKPSGWKPSGPAGPSGPSWITSRWARIAAVLAGLATLAVALVIILLWPRPSRAPALILIEAGYEANLAVPHNVAGRNASRAIAEWAAKHSEQASRGDYRKIDATRAQLEPEGEEVLKKIESLRSGTFSSKPPDKVVLYVAAHGIAMPAEDGTLTAYLVPEGYSPAEPAKLFKLDRLLDALAALPKDTQKLLVLDTGGVRASWSLGQFQPSFVAALETERYQDKIRAIENFCVLTSAGKNQPAWVDEENRMSTFAAHILDGLEGGADEDGDRVITALELHRYLARKVADWARHNRARLQEPALYPMKEEGANRARQMPLAHYESYKQAELPTPSESPELEGCKKSWERARALEAESPWSHAPHRWRQCLEMLVRAEELARAGDGANAAIVRGEADKLAGEIASSRELTADSMRLSIPMLESFGVRLSEAEAGWLKKFGQSLQAGDLAACTKMASRLEGGTGSRWARQVQRLRAAEAVLRYVAEAPATRGPACKPLLTALDDALEPWRPAESQYLTLVLDDRAPPPPVDAKLAEQRWPLIGKAIQARLRAEEAALGARADAPPAPEDLLPWVKPLTQKGDVARRLGMDLLFTTVPEQWKAAGKHLADADTEYGQAEEAGRYVLRARRDCQKALARLPFLSRWLAEQSLDKDGESLVEQAWMKAHNLHLEIQQGPSGSPYRHAARLNGMLDGLAGDLARIEARAQQAAADLADPPVTDVSWHRIDAYLRMPVIDVALRAKLVKDSARISRELHETGRKAARAGGAENTADLVRAEAARQARFAAAAAAEKPEERDALITREALERPDLGARLVKLMAERAADAIKKADDASRAAMPEAEKLLSRAAALARLLDGWAASTLTRDPVDALRQARAHNLLCWQAERFYLDHFAGGQAGTDGKPYFHAAATRLLADARRRAEANVDTTAKVEGRFEQVKALQARVASAAPLVLEWAMSKKGSYTAGGGAFHLTDEPSAERFYRLTGPKDIEGVSVRWATATQGLATPPAGVAPWSLGEPMAFAISPDADLYKRRKRTAKYSIDAYFRGQRASAEMAVTVHREPDHLAVEPPRPPRSSVAVLTDDKAFAEHVASKHAICIVLDCSGSMLSKGADGITKWDGARKALKDVLYQMPDGVQVSLIVYSAKGFQPPQGKDEDVGRGGIKVVWERHAWKGADRDARLKEVDKLEPESATPLMRSIKMARDQIPVEFRGRRSIVAITDGGDYNFYRSEYVNKMPGRKPIADLDADLKKKGTLRTISAFLSDTFAPPYDDFKVNVIGFGLGEMDPWEARAHKELKPALIKIGGHYVEARNTAELTAALTRNLLRLDYELVAAAKEEGFDVPPLQGDIGRVYRDTGRRDNLRWLDVPPGSRTLKVPLMKSVSQEVRTQPGDALILEMLPRASGMAFRRWMYIRSFARGGAFREIAEPVDSWTLGVVECWQEGAGRMLSMATLEKDQGVAEPGQPVQIIHPSWTWLELEQAKRKLTAPAMRAVTLYNYPAPAFGMEVPFWPLDEPARLRAWWLADTKPIASRLSLRGERLLDQQEKKLAFEAAEDEAILESATMEKECLVPYRQDGREDVTVANCLVVRLRYLRGKGPYFAEVGSGPWKGGVAHRFFHEAGKSTSIFWLAEGKLKEEDVERIREVRVYSVAALKAAAMKREVSLGAPASGNRRPQEIER